VSINLLYSVHVQGTGRSAKMVTKKESKTKAATIDFENIQRVELIEACLKAHGLHNQFAPGPHSGPGFKMWWTGNA
jgi:hypothetical protein